MDPKPPLASRILRYPLTRLLLSLLVMAGVMLGAGRLFPIHGPSGELTSAWTLIPAELSLAVAALVAMLSVGLGVERASLSGLGFGRDVGRMLGGGFAGGAAMLTLSVGVLAVCGWYRLGGAGARISGGGFLGAVLLFLLVAVFEEVLFRGIFFRLLEQWLGTWIALLLTAVQFGWVHHRNPGATWLSTVGIAIEAGVLLAGAFVVTRSLWAPIGLHWAWNLFEGPVFGTPVSGMNLPHLLQPSIAGPTLWTGGAFGPEAGLACMLAGGGFGVLLMGLAVKRGQILTPPWLSRLLGRRPGNPVPTPPAATP
jgi:membrane protease YdiL (CAAX protease family)